MGIFDALFGSNTQRTTDAAALPAWYSAYLEDLASRSRTQSVQPYQTYPGPRVAPLTADQNAAYAQTRAGIGQYQPYLEQGRSMIETAGGPFNQTEFNKYLSPYTGGVVDEIARLGTRNLSENLLPQVNSTFTGEGQYGGSRHADFTGRAVRDANESIMGAQAMALQQAQDAAMRGYQEGQGRTLAAGEGIAGIGGMGQSMNLRDAASLEAIGQAQQGQTQANLDVGYQNFQTQQGYPWQQMQNQANILYGQPQPTSTTSTTTGVRPSPISQLGGLAVGGIGLYNAFQKTGGRVNRKRVKRSMPMAGIGGMGMNSGRYDRMGMVA